MPPTSTQLPVRRISASTSIIALQGQVTALTEHALVDAYTQVSSPTTRSVILDFSRLEYMNSVGFGLMVTLLSRISAQNQCLLAFGLNEHYQQLFRLTRLNDAIAIYRTETEALAAAQAAEERGHRPAKERRG
jgi:anti-sigma B factor antagonist